MKLELNLNGNPNSYQNLCLIDAKNVQLSSDGSSIENETSIIKDKEYELFLQSLQDNSINTNSNYLRAKIRGVIECNDELVIFLEDKKTLCSIIRYKQTNNSSKIKEAYGCNINDNRIYVGNNTKVIGAFTYNVNGELIVSFSCKPVGENEGENIPIKTINLGRFDSNNLSTDVDLPDYKLSNVPKVNLPNVNFIKYLKGNSYKGYHHIFIRYKINKKDYTKWYHIGLPIYVDSYSRQSIIKHAFRHNDRAYQVGVSDNISDSFEHCNITYNVELQNVDEGYKEYQLGVIITSKSYTKTFRTNDIKSINKSFIFDINHLVSYSEQRLLLDNNNYYDVRHIINYGNRLYIAGYKEDKVLDLTKYANKITAKLYINNKKSVEETNDNNSNHSTEEDEVTIRQLEGKISALENEIRDKDVAIAALQDLIPNIDPSDIEGLTNIYRDINILKNEKTELQNEIERIKNRIENIKNNNGKTESNKYIDLSFYKMFSGEPSEDLEFIISDNYDTDSVYKPNLKLLKDYKQISFVSKNEIKAYALTDLVNGEYKVKSVIIDIDTLGVYTLDESLKSRFIIPINNQHSLPELESKVREEGYAVTMVLQTGIRDRNSNIEFALNPLTRFSSYLKDENEESLEDIKEKYNNTLIPGEVYNFFIHYVDKYGSSTLGYKIENKEENNIEMFINSKGDKLFKMPNDINNNAFNHSTKIHIEFSNIKIPSGYVGYFISYEKPERINRVNGILIKDNNLNRLLFYSPDFDVNDSVKLDFNKMNLVYDAVFDVYRYYDKSEGYDIESVSSTYNIQAVKFNKHLNKIYEIEDYKLLVGDSAIHTRYGLGTALHIKLKDKNINMHKDGALVSLLNDRQSIYLSENKTLIKLTNIEENSSILIDKGLDGFITIKGSLIYDSRGVVLNNDTAEVKSILDNENYDAHKNRWFAEYRTYPTVEDTLFESKQFNNEPKVLVYPGKDKTNAIFGSFVEPKNSIDLFKKPQTSIYDLHPKTYSNYRKDIIYQYEFNKTIRRSNIIKDENYENSWRVFPQEAYKNITENKGDIRNIVGVGYLFLIHTEHSMFSFDASTMLQTTEQNKIVQSYMPDIFETRYREVFTSELGFAGLQDEEAYVFGDFGYIWFNNDFNRFYRFNNNSIDVIDSNIYEWILYKAPVQVKLFNDREHNRLLISIYSVKKKQRYTLSYNLLTKHFISLHDYNIKSAYNTKSKVYFIHSDLLYKFDNIYGSRNIFFDSDLIKSSITFAIKENNEKVFTLNSLEYSLRLYNETKGRNVNKPVEGNVMYPADYIRVYTDIGDTGLMYIGDTVVNEEYPNNDKPFWYKGVWKFNKIRDYRSVVRQDSPSVLFGKYAAVQIDFKRLTLVSFEHINYNIEYRQ